MLLFRNLFTITKFYVTPCSENKNFCEVFFLCFLYSELLCERKWTNIFICRQLWIFQTQKLLQGMLSVVVMKVMHGVDHREYTIRRAHFQFAVAVLVLTTYWEFIHIVWLICLAASSSEPYFITNSYFTNLLLVLCHPSLV